MRAAEFLGATPGEDGSWHFHIPVELHGAFGGAFGGVVAAAAIMTARAVVDGRRPAALDVRFLRSLPAGAVRAIPTVLHAGRTLACVSVDLSTDDGRLAARATVSLVADEALAAVNAEHTERHGGISDARRASGRATGARRSRILLRGSRWPSVVSL